jgi:ADP-heptose:LPS heptosyltransferase
VISNNSGVAHLAAACGAPTLTIYSGSHQPQEWGPRGNVRLHGAGAVFALRAREVGAMPQRPFVYEADRARGHR